VFVNGELPELIKVPFEYNSIYPADGVLISATIVTLAPDSTVIFSSLLFNVRLITDVSFVTRYSN